METEKEKLEARLKYLQELLVVIPVHKTFRIHAEIVAIKEQLSRLVVLWMLIIKQEIEMSLSEAYYLWVAQCQSYDYQYSTVMETGFVV